MIKPDLSCTSLYCRHNDQGTCVVRVPYYPGEKIDHCTFFEQGAYENPPVKCETWRVTSNTIDGQKMYGVYRTLDPAEPDHSGNREIFGEYVTNREAARELADMLNDLVDQLIGHVDNAAAEKKV